MSIEEFIEARIAEDERVARAATEQRGDEHSKWHVSGSPGAKGVESGGRLETIWEDEPQEWVGTFPVVYGEGSPSDDQAEHIARHDPARVLRQCAALREALHAYELAGNSAGYAEMTADTWVLLRDNVIRPAAAIWSDHADYQQEWAK